VSGVAPRLPSRLARAAPAARLPALAACAALYGVSVAALLLSHLGHGWGFVDLAVYRYGGEAVLHGAHLYDLRFPGALAFTYPPLSGVAFTALTRAPLSVLEPLLTAVNLLLLPLMLHLALRLRPPQESVTRERAMRVALLAAALALWFEPVWTTLRYGQIDLLIAVLILLDLSRADGSRWKGAGIGLAAGLKLTPAIFALYLLLTRRSRAAAMSASVFIATVALGFALVPGDSRAFWGGAFLDSGRVGRIENAANQSLRGAYARLLHSTSIEALWICTAVVVAAVGMTVAVLAGRRGDDARGVSACALTALLISPISWSHHWVLAIPALMLLAIEARRAGSRTAQAAVELAALAALTHVIWWVPVNHPRHSELHLGALQLFYSDAYVLLAALALAAMGASLVGGVRARAPASNAEAPAGAWRASRVGAG
jgi:alpha-1,2-mannosyltransferase